MSKYICEECAQEFDFIDKFHYYMDGDEPCIGRLFPNTTPVKIDRSRNWANVLIAIWALTATIAIIAALIANKLGL